MFNKNTIRVSEFEKLYYDQAKPFKKKHWEALCKFHQGWKEYYHIINNGIKFTSYVGVIQAGDLTIEILPKTDRHLSSAANLSVAELQTADPHVSSGKQAWHNVLLQMLKECRLLNIQQAGQAQLNFKSNSILDIYIEMFLTLLEKLLHEGLVKKYAQHEGNSGFLKGQLLFKRDMQENLVHRNRFYTRHTQYNNNNIFNQVLYKTLVSVPSICNNPGMLDKVNRILLDMPVMDDIPVTPDLFDKLLFDRKTERYREILQISRMLLLNYRPDITGGHENLIAILFDMNSLWEEFVYRRLLKASLPVHGMKVLRQQKKPFWYHQQKKSYKLVRPDIVIEYGNQRYIIDTKWKSDPEGGPADNDLKQLFVYNLLWNARNAYLLYPGKYETQKGSYLHFSLSQKLQETEDALYCNHCSLVFVDILEGNNQLKQTIGNEVLEIIFSKEKKG
jgi:5-methylcytosine-specific restriction enzyme subunit McrC